MSSPSDRHPHRIFKVFRDDEWSAFERAGRTMGVAVDLADGYIHLSTKDTLQETIDKWFTDVDAVRVVEFDARDFDETLRWEESRGGLLFPHIYGALGLGQVVGRWRVERDARGRLALPGLDAPATETRP